MNPNTAPLVANGPVRATGTRYRFWYRNTSATGSEFFLVMRSKATRRRFNHPPRRGVDDGNGQAGGDARLPFQQITLPPTARRSRSRAAISVDLRRARPRCSSAIGHDLCRTARCRLTSTRPSSGLQPLVRDMTTGADKSADASGLRLRHRQCGLDQQRPCGAEVVAGLEKDCHLPQDQRKVGDMYSCQHRRGPPDTKAWSTRCPATKTR